MFIALVNKAVISINSLIELETSGENVINFHIDTVLDK